MTDWAKNWHSSRVAPLVLRSRHLGHAREAEPSAPDFEAVYDAHFDFVWRSLRRLGVPAEHLDDATQEVFLVVHRRLRGFEGRSALKTWVFGIVLRVSQATRRAARRGAAEPLVEEAMASGSATPAEITEKAEAARLVHALLGTLSEDQRAVFVLAELEQMTAREIADALKVNVNTVYSRLRAARKDFSAALQRHRARSQR